MPPEAGLDDKLHGNGAGGLVRVLMLGWEFPPFISGGLGTACHGLTRAMTRMDLQVLFVLPKAITPGPRFHFIHER